jgi:hypothetical protein
MHVIRMQLMTNINLVRVLKENKFESVEFTRQKMHFY